MPRRNSDVGKVGPLTTEDLLDMEVEGMARRLVESSPAFKKMRSRMEKELRSKVKSLRRTPLIRSARSS